MTTRVGWLQRRHEDVPEGDGWLTAAERAVERALRTEPRRAEWRLGRWTAKVAVASAASTAPELVEVLAADDGAPEVRLTGGGAAPVVSISHRTGVAVCAVGPPGLRLGCDLELVEPREPVFVADWFTAAERTAVDGASSTDRDRLVTLVWSAKEAALKALRLGLTADTRSVEVSADGADVGAVPATWARLRVREREPHRTLTGWWLPLPPLLVTVVTDVPVAAPWRLDPAR